MSDRETVISIGEKLPAKIRRSVKSLGMQLMKGRHATFDPFKENAHAVLWYVTPNSLGNLRGRLERLIEPILDSGALLVFMGSNPRCAAAISSLINEQAQLVRPNVRMIGSVYRGLRLICRNTRDLATLLRNHDSGPRHDSTIGLPPELEKTLAGKLLRRAFHGFRGLAIREIDGGKSGSTVWRVDATKNDQYCEPFIAKIGPWEALEVENNTWKQFILDYVPFPFRAPPIRDRLVYGANKAILVSRFVDRATRFDDYIAQVNDPGGAIAALFNGALRTWRSQATAMRNVRLGAMYVAQMEADKAGADDAKGLPPQSILPDFERLVNSHQLAVTADSHLPDPAELRAMLREIPQMGIREALVHGDLNARNLFVTWSGSQIVLIDFSHAGVRGPLSRDPSRLEVSIACDRNKAGEVLSENVLFDLFRYPLLHHPIAARREDGRIEAVKQIRRHVAGEGVGNREYALTTACHLLRHARNPRGQNQDDRGSESQLRALFYRLAVGLIVSLLQM